MNHPNSEAWLEYLEGGGSPEQQARLRKHLAECPPCAAEMAGWRRSIHSLQTWSWPRREAAAPARLPGWVKWGVAATLVLSIGFGLGRWSDRRAISFQAARVAELRRQVREDVRADLLAALSPANAAVTNEFQAPLREAIQVALGHNLVFPVREQQRLIDEILQVVGRGREEDQQATQALFREAGEREAARYFSLRKDLETLAATADDRLQQARWQLAQFATDTHLNPHH
jgi:hypothetical protein